MKFYSKYILIFITFLTMCYGSTLAQARVSASASIKLKVVKAITPSILTSNNNHSENKTVIEKNKDRTILIYFDERTQQNSNNTLKIKPKSNLKITNSQNYLLANAKVGDEIFLENISKTENLHFIANNKDKILLNPSITIIY